VAPHGRGDLTRTQTLLFSAVLCSLGSLLLWAVNPLTMWLTLATFVGYAIVYTVVLKPATPQNIVIGGARAPCRRCWAGPRCAVTSAPRRWLLVLIIFVWTPPHFWALALYRADDYREGWPADAARHARQRLHAPADPALHVGAVRGHAAAVHPGHERLGLPGRRRGAGRLVHRATAFRLWRAYSEGLARRTFRFSIWYLALLFAALLLDHYL
jgi:protoheme IX farnesyltransferase